MVRSGSARPDHGPGWMRIGSGWPFLVVSNRTGTGVGVVAGIGVGRSQLFSAESSRSQSRQNVPTSIDSRQYLIFTYFSSLFVMGWLYDWLWAWLSRAYQLLPYHRRANNGPGTGRRFPRPATITCWEEPFRGPRRASSPLTGQILPPESAGPPGDQYRVQALVAVCTSLTIPSGRGGCAA